MNASASFGSLAYQTPNCKTCAAAEMDLISPILAGKYFCYSPVIIWGNQVCHGCRTSVLNH